MTKTLVRCSWCWGDPLYVRYHDEEWGRPAHADEKLFEFLTLEWAQAGLSWITVLRKRENYRSLFHDWDIENIATMTDEVLEKILLDPGIIRNRLKVYSVRKNAQVALEIQKEFGSLDAYFWNSQWFCHSEVRRIQVPETLDPSYRQDDRNKFPIINHPTSLSGLPAESNLSKMISKDLKKRGMSFVGSTIIYAFMQATGMVDDHIENCFCKENTESITHSWYITED